MTIGGVKILDKSISENKVQNTAVTTIRLAKGQKFKIEDNVGFSLLEVENDTKRVKIRGHIVKV